MRTDKTAAAARQIVNLMKEIVDANVFKIEMKTPYAADYRTCIDQAQKDLRSGARPELLKELEHIDGYDTVILVCRLIHL